MVFQVGVCELLVLTAPESPLVAPTAMIAPDSTNGGRPYDLCQADLGSGGAGIW